MLRWSIFTSLLLVAAGAVGGWLRDDQKKKWSARIALIGLVGFVTVFHNLVVKSESDFKYTQTSDGPSSFESILRVIESSKSQILIATPFAAYGDFSEPDFFKKYSEALKRKQASGVKISMYVLPEPVRRIRLAAEFENRWKAYEARERGATVSPEITGSLRETPQQFANKLERYYKTFAPTEKPHNFESFLALLTSHELSFVVDPGQPKGTGELIVNSITEQQVPYSLWVADSSQAAFTNDATYQIFVTRDPELITFLRGSIANVSSLSP